MIRNPNIPTIGGLPVPYKFIPTKRDDAVIVSALPCVLYSVWVDYSGEVECYLHVFEAASMPGNNMEPTLPPVPISPGEFRIVDYMPGCPMVGGVAVALSSTRDSLTRLANQTGKFSAIYFPLDEI